MRYLSLFSGVEAATLAWAPLGWTAVGFSEIDPFCANLLKHYWPDVPNLGDVTRITDEMIASLGPIDLVMYGFPCQDASVCGNRQGLRNDDGSATRSGLFYEATRIVRSAAQHCGCRWQVFENVPGLFSVNGGRDFAQVVGEITGLPVSVPEGGWQKAGLVRNHRPDGWQFGWRTLDAVYAGVPQRRQRIFACGYLGYDISGVAEVLFNAESMPWSSGPSRKKRKGAAGSAERRVAEQRSLDLGVVAYGGNDTQGSIDVACCLNAHPSGSRMDFATETLVVEVPLAFQTRLLRNGRGAPSKIVPCLSSAECDGHADTKPHVIIPAEAFKPSYYTRGKDGAPSETHPPKEADADKGDQDPVVRVGSRVRRLLPVEHERLMGFPDGHTDVSFRGKPASDSQRYRVVGNSIVVPNLHWLGERIDLIHRRIKP